MLVEIRNIEYDIDYDDYLEGEDYPVLDKTIMVTILESELEECELEEILSDFISDKSGFCHKGFDYEIISA
jgi:hypothetical protein